MATDTLTSNDLLLSMALRDAKWASSVEPVLPIFTEDRYVLAWYVCNFSKTHQKLTRFTLDAALKDNSLSWVSKHSILVESGKITTDFIQQNVEGNPQTPVEYAEALRVICLNTYDKLIDTSYTPEQEEVSSILDSVKGYAAIQEANDIMTAGYMLTTGGKDYIRIGKVKYYPKDILYFLKERILDSINRLDFSVDNEDYVHRMNRYLAKGLDDSTGIFHLNLGQKVLPDFCPTYVLTVNAAPKVGKTRFVIGEIVFPALLEGKNVKYLTGEMSPFLICRMLLTKYIYEVFGEKPQDTLVGFILGYNNSKRLGLEIKEKDQAFFDSIPKVTVELITQAEYELFFSGHYGKLLIIHLSDDSGEGAKQFNIDTWDELTIKEQAELAPEDRHDVIVLDHADHMESVRYANNDAARLSLVYKKGKAIANCKYKHCLVVIINHLKEEDAKDAEKSESLSGKQYRSFGTTADGKNCDVSISLIEKTEQKRNGEMSLLVCQSRYVPMLEKFSTTEFPMKADKERCDFCIIGYKKPPYKRVFFD